MKYNLPPRGGGQRDQPALWFEHAELLHRIYNAHVAYKQREAGRDAAWIKNHPEQWRLVRYVQELMNG